MPLYCIIMSVSVSMSISLCDVMCGVTSILKIGRHCRIKYSKKKTNVSFRFISCHSIYTTFNTTIHTQQQQYNTYTITTKTYTKPFEHHLPPFQAHES